MRVEYDSNRHREGAGEIAEATLRFFRKGLDARQGTDPASWAHVFFPAWDNLLQWINPLVKDSAFKSENECRIVRRLQSGEHSNLIFRRKNALMARHLPLAFQASDNESSKLPISEVLVGPSRYKEISRKSVEALLQKYGYSVPVSLSQIPFQTT
jgi:hypothetical protein